MTDTINYYYINGTDQDGNNANVLYGSYDLKEVKEELQILKEDGYKRLTINKTPFLEV
tara:strand:- start:153 stop:326 length:174 start_codon:yes stop_codon:yes gene_type:complete